MPDEPLVVEIGTLLAVKMLDGDNEALCRVFNPRHYGGIRVEWLPAQGKFVRCKHDISDNFSGSPIHSTLPPTPNTPNMRMGLPAPGEWRLLTPEEKAQVK